MAASLTKPFLGAPHTSTGSLHSPSLLLSRNIIHLPDRRSQLKRLGLTIGSPIKFYSETPLGCRPSRAYCLSSKQAIVRSKVSGGALAMSLIKSYAGTDILAYVSQVHRVALPESLVDHETLTHGQIKGSTIRCPNPEYARKMIAAIDAVRVRGDTVGGTVTCIVRNFPRCRGSRVFQEIAAVLAKGVMTVPQTAGFEIGSGFTGTFMTGTEYIDESGQSSGIQGGIIKMRIAVKPRVPISMSGVTPMQRRKNTVSRDKHKEESIDIGDFCAVPRVSSRVELMVAQVLLCKLLVEGPSNAAHEPLESPESAKAQIPLESSLDCFAALFCSPSVR